MWLNKHHPVGTIILGGIMLVVTMHTGNLELYIQNHCSPNLMPSLIKHISRPNRLLCHRKGEEVDRNQVGLSQENYSMSSENQNYHSILHNSWDWRKEENVLLGAT